MVKLFPLLKLTLFLSLCISDGFGQRADQIRSSYNLSDEVSSCKELEVDLKEPSDTLLLNGVESDLPWRAGLYYTYNRKGETIRYQEFQLKRLILYFYTYNNDGKFVTEEEYDGEKYSKSFYHYNEKKQLVEIEIYGKDNVGCLENKTFTYQDTLLKTMEYFYKREESEKDYTHALIEYVYNLNGNLFTQKEFVNGDPFTEIITDIQSGRTVSYANFQGEEIRDITSYTYDLQGRIATDSFRVFRLVDPIVSSEIYTYTPEGWKIEYCSIEYHMFSDTIEKGWVIHYNFKGEMISSTKGGSDIVYKYTYDLYGNWIYKIKIKDGKPESVEWRQLTYF